MAIDSMPTLAAFYEAGKTVVSLGASTNASCRQEIREVVGRLADELDRALSLADSYLVGVQFSKDDNEMARYLANVDQNLMKSFLEHHICAGLYHLADEFKQVFNPKRFSISISNHQEIPNLITLLKNGERAVLDDLDELATDLRDLGTKLRTSKDSVKSEVRQEITNSVEYHRQALTKHRRRIKTLRRKITDTL